MGILNQHTKVLTFEITYWLCFPMSGPLAVILSYVIYFQNSLSKYKIIISNKRNKLTPPNRYDNYCCHWQTVKQFKNLASCRGKSSKPGTMDWRSDSKSAFSVCEECQWLETPENDFKWMQLVTKQKWINAKIKNKVKQNKKQKNTVSLTSRQEKKDTAQEVIVLTRRV